MMHTTLIVLHAAAGIISFAAGCFLIFSGKYKYKQQTFNTYWWSLVGLVVFMAGAIIAGWEKHSGSERIIFPGLFILSIYMLYRAVKARGLLKFKPNGWQKSFIDHIGFTIISLFEGFIIVAAIDLHSPAWLVAIFALLGVIIGSRTVNAAKSKT